MDDPLVYVRAVHFAATISVAGVAFFVVFVAEPAFRKSMPARRSSQIIRRTWHGSVGSACCWPCFPARLGSSWCRSPSATSRWQTSCLKTSFGRSCWRRILAVTGWRDWRWPAFSPACRLPFLSAKPVRPGLDQTRRRVCGRRPRRHLGLGGPRIRRLRPPGRCPPGRRRGASRRRHGVGRRLAAACIDAWSGRRRCRSGRHGAYGDDSLFDPWHGQRRHAPCHRCNQHLVSCGQHPGA